MDSELLVNIKEEVTCPICLELLIVPLSLDCGHSFCQACISENQKKSTIDKEGQSCCPVCRITYQLENLRPNRPLANIVERLKEVKLNQEEGQEVNHCEQHGEKLLLFCKEDGEVICWLCERSQKHRGHHTFLLEEAAQEYQKRLQGVLEKLMKQQQEVEQVEDDISKERTSWKDQIQSDRQNIQAQFGKLRDFLVSEENNKLQILEEEEKDILNSLAESKNELDQHHQVVRMFISDVERRLQAPAIEMLQDVNGMIKRYETLTLKKPKTFPKEQRKVFPLPDLRGLLQVLKREMYVSAELREARRHLVYVTLIPRNKSNVIISSDNREVRSGQDDWDPEELMDNYGILAAPHFTSGKWYWEVDVTNKRSWILGVYVKHGLPFNEKVRNTANVRYQPRNGYWVIGLKHISQYIAFHDSSTFGPLPLSLTVPPNRIGVFLDYAAGAVSFFNVTDHGSLIYRFCTRFQHRINPYFNTTACQVHMTLC
ncbi:tripartite motif-containing protein 5-like [Nycticebus coucang]|uniref:tripartite motif-containing protein 5-like n=1 Tax=Nycticebus coucang TaxID=9470 RepID=UPI00234D827B|nr:tripartite motif-containing protein 5-like [Nycticebus coucang]